jgi:thiol-disulfide isomerase/thioredoxin
MKIGMHTRTFRASSAALGLMAGLLSLALASSAFASPPEINAMEMFRLLNQSKGKVVVVNFFATWCPPCVLEVPGLMEIRKQYPDSELTLVSVSFDTDMEKLDGFLDTAKVNYTVYTGAQDVAEAFQVVGLPKLLVYNKKGALEVNHNGFMTPDKLKETIETLKNKQ